MVALLVALALSSGVATPALIWFTDGVGHVVGQALISAWHQTHSYALLHGKATTQATHRRAAP